MENKEQMPAPEKTSSQAPKKTLAEVIRFVVVGVAATIIDFGIEWILMKYVFANNLSLADGGKGSYGSWCIAVLVGYLLSSIVNFILSRIWVFQNVDKNVHTDNQKSFWIFVFLGFGGVLLGIGIQVLGVYFANLANPSIGIDLDVTKVSWSNLFNEGGASFWVFCLIFVIKTLITMFYNYYTRKKFIFKAPKKEADSAVYPEAK